MLSVVDPGRASTDAGGRFDDLFRHYYPRLVGLAERMLGDRVEAEDVLQDAFLRLARGVGREDTSDPPDSTAGGAVMGPLLDRPDEAIGAWLRRVVLNLGLNRLRERRRAAERLERVKLDPTLSPSGEPDAVASPTQHVLRAEARAEVQAVLATLPERQRSCLLLRHAGYSYAEIAATLGIAIGSVGVYLARAERAFRVTYEATTASRDRVTGPNCDRG